MESADQAPAVSQAYLGKLRVKRMNSRDSLSATPFGYQLSYLPGVDLSQFFNLPLSRFPYLQIGDKDISLPCWVMLRDKFIHNICYALTLGSTVFIICNQIRLARIVSKPIALHTSPDK